MKNVCLLGFFSLIVTLATSQNIQFPDPIFKLRLTSTKCVDLDGDAGGDADADLDDDGEISITEAAEARRLILENQAIKSVEGINHFVNLEYLWIPFNQLDSLHISGLLKLETLSCKFNQIATLELSHLPQLKYLYCADNQISSLQLDALPEILWLDCGNNKINKLDISGFPKIITLSCVNNQLTELELGIPLQLELLYFDFNQVDSLHISNLPNLNQLTCSENKITSLHLSNLPNLDLLDCNLNHLESLNLELVPNIKWVYASFNNIEVLRANGCSELVEMILVDNNLKYLFLNTGHNLEDLVLTLNPNLKYICCGENEINRMLDILVIYNISGCEVNSYCVFSSIDQSNLVNGRALFAPPNEDCSFQAEPIPYLKYSVEDSMSNKKYFISNHSGDYTITLDKGRWKIKPEIEQADFFEINPIILDTTLTEKDTIYQNFCITQKIPYRQILITVIPLSPPARPGFDAQYKILWENKGNLLENGTIHFTYDENIFDYVKAALSPDAINSGKLSWDFTNLLPFENREITVTLNLNSPMENPPVNPGDITYLYANILDNIFTLENTIVGSYDPNDKTCLQGNYFHPDSVGKYVDFLIRFENTGNYAAENIVVKDIIDDKVFDVSSLQITDASHEMYTRIAGNKVEFIFEDIQLPFDDEHNDGYVAFKIKTKSTMVLGDSLKNLADIYFDYNFPIRTNETQTTVAIPSKTKDEAIDVIVYPNPVRDLLFLEGDVHWQKAEIYDLTGRLIRVNYPENKSMDVCAMQSGTYLLKLSSKDKTGWVKFVKM